MKGAAHASEYTWHCARLVARAGTLPVLHSIVYPFEDFALFRVWKTLKDSQPYPAPKLAECHIILQTYSIRIIKTGSVMRVERRTVFTNGFPRRGFINGDVATTDLSNLLLVRNLPTVVIHEGRGEGCCSCVRQHSAARQLVATGSEISSRPLPVL